MLRDEFKKAISSDLTEYKESLHDINGVLTLKIESPCKELECLYACVMEHEITISVKNFHTHIDELEAKLKGAKSIASLAVDKISSIIEGTYYFSETYSGNERQCSGGSPCKLDQESKEKLTQMFGPGTYSKEWNWYGEI